MSDYEKSSDKTHATALTAEEWAALSAKSHGLYVVVQRDAFGHMVSKPYDHAGAGRIFAGVLDQCRTAFQPDTGVSMRVMSVSEWARVGATPGQMER